MVAALVETWSGAKGADTEHGMPTTKQQARDEVNQAFHKIEEATGMLWHLKDKAMRAHGLGVGAKLVRACRILDDAISAAQTTFLAEMARD